MSSPEKHIYVSASSGPDKLFTPNELTDFLPQTSETSGYVDPQKAIALAKERGGINDPEVQALVNRVMEYWEDRATMFGNHEAQVSVEMKMTEFQYDLGVLSGEEAIEQLFDIHDRANSDDRIPQEFFDELRDIGARIEQEAGLFQG